MKLTRFQLKIIKYAIEDKLEITERSYDYWKNYDGPNISVHKKALVLCDIENDIKDYQHIISEVSNALCEES